MTASKRATSETTSTSAWEGSDASDPIRASGKVSAEFAARLQRLAEDEPIRVLLLARRPSPSGRRAADTGAGQTDAGYEAEAAQTESRDRGDRPSREQRHAQNMAAAHAAVADAFPQVDRVLAATGGSRETQMPNALGHIVVETTRRGVEALCRLDCLTAILEDQSIHPQRPVPYPVTEPGNEE